MEYRMLGRTGLRVSEIGFGGIPIQRTSAAVTRTLMERLVDKGINFIDTARAYTVSEGYLGEALVGMRDKFVLATKSPARTYDAMAADIDKSLAALRTDHIDLYQLHNMRTDADFEAVFGPHGAAAAVQDAIRAGKVGHFGATAHSLSCAERLLDEPSVETLMFPYNIVESQGEPLMERCTRQGVGFIAMKPLAGGNITDGTLALRYLLHNKNCTVAIPGMASPEEIDANAAAAEIEGALTAAEQADIEKVRDQLSGNFCRRCGYCAPCSVGIDIPSLFILQGYLEHYDLAQWARDRYATAPVKADACVQCGVCETRCPYNLPIREKMQAVAKAFAQPQR